MLKRERYLRRLRPVYHQDLIKVITGVRRCGKSVLLRQIMDELLVDGVPTDHIIYLNFEDFDNHPYTDPHALHQYLKQHLTRRGRYYLFFDEIQEVRDFERVINSWRATAGCSIFITGSNSKLLSSELATYLTGRTLSYKLQPFTFSEFTQFRQTGADKDELFDEYLNWGGFPQIYHSDNLDQRKTYLSDLYHAIIAKDIIQRENIKNVELLHRVAWFLLTNIGHLVSANSIATFLKNEHLSVSVDTIINYIDYLDAAMIFARARRYNLKGRSLMRTQDKHFATDLGWLQLKNSPTPSLSAKLENIVYAELSARNQEVYVGKTDNGEIDFVTHDFGGRTTYYQVTTSLKQDSVYQREFAAFASIDDNFPKIVLSLDTLDFSHQGYQHYYLLDWLLEVPKDN